MEEEKTSQDIHKYAEDIATIKSMLMAMDEKFFYDPWVFYIWGVVVLAGAAVQYILNTAYAVSLSAIFYKLWIPAIIAGFFLEGIAWITKMSKEGVPIFARYLLKMWVGSMGSLGGIAIMIIMVIELGGAQYVPVIILIIFAVFMFHVAQVSYVFFFVYGYMFLGAALTLFLSDISSVYQFLLSEVFIGLIMIALGVSTCLKERKHEN